ncbi:hypothetical protein BY996DRAFT_6434304 [Phakopsora pachyrhizi]|nr:hypothetical protein BY996DRAFT_6434304 [Phakopsora pachyrhizi]
MSTQPLLQRPAGKRIALPVRVEPNERTFLSWLNFTVVLGGLGVGLLNFGDRIGKISAVLFTLVALVTFHWRASAIKKRGSGNYDDRIAAVMTNFVLRFSESKV